MVLLELLKDSWEVILVVVFLYALYLWTYNENANLILTGNKDGRKSFEREARMTEQDYMELMQKTIDQEIHKKIEKSPVGLLRRQSVQDLQSVVIYYATRAGMYPTMESRKQRRVAYAAKDWRKYRSLVLQEEKSKQERYARFAQTMLSAVNLEQNVFA